MTDRYKVPAHSFSELCRTASQVPDRVYADAMGRDHTQLMEGWTRNLSAHVDRIAAEAWAAGAQWAMEVSARPIQLMVSEEAYQKWEEEARDG